MKRLSALRRASGSSLSAVPRRWWIPSASCRGCAPKATSSRATIAAPTSSSSTPAAFSIPPRPSRSRAIGEAMAENGRVIVTGCMGAEPDAILAKFPNVLAVTGPQQYEQVVAAVHQAAAPAHDPFLDLVPPQGIRLTPRHYAYLKISEGCSNRCSFCIIPQLARRPRLASRRRGAARGRAAGEGRREGAPGHQPGHLGLWARPEIRRPPPSRTARCARSSSTSPASWASSACGCGCTTSTPIRTSTR